MARGLFFATCGLTLAVATAIAAQTGPQKDGARNLAHGSVMRHNGQSLEIPRVLNHTTGDVRSASALIVMCKNDKTSAVFQHLLDLPADTTLSMTSHGGKAQDIGFAKTLGRKATVQRPVALLESMLANASFSFKTNAPNLGGRAGFVIDPFVIGQIYQIYQIAEVRGWAKTLPRLDDGLKQHPVKGHPRLGIESS